MVLLMVSICSSFVLLGSALTPEETVAKLDTMLSLSNLYKPKEIELFKEYVLKTQRKYSDELEIRARMGYFKEHLRLKPDSESQYCSRSDFSDRSRKEILQKTGYVPAGKLREQIAADAPYIEDMLKTFTKPLPKSFDWRKKNVLDKVRNQHDCGSCWAFSFIAMVEAQVAIHFKKPVMSLSKSQLVECDDNDYGCGGGGVNGAWLYITRHGYETERDYPFRNGDGFVGKCKHDKKKSFLYLKDTEYKGNNISNSVGISKSNLHVHLTGHIKKHFEGEEKIKRILVNRGPVTVTLASFYLDPYLRRFSKILEIDPDCCANQAIDHMVVIVGYGVKNGVKYWIVRNSWGEIWADKGYVKLERGINVCGIEQDASAIFTDSKSLV